MVYYEKLQCSSASEASNNNQMSLNRVKISQQELEEISREEIVKLWNEREKYIDYIEEQQNIKTYTVSQEHEDRARQQQLEAARRENLLVMRLTTKEQDMQELLAQITELKAAQTPSIAALRSHLLDPAVNLLLEKLIHELDATKCKLEETQNELSAWKFTPDSNTGKLLLAKCRMLFQENQEFGRMVNSGKLAKLEGDLALQRSFSEEMKNSQADKYLEEMEEDVEGMQSTIYHLQQQLREAKEHNIRLLQENEKLQRGKLKPHPDCNQQLGSQVPFEDSDSTNPEWMTHANGSLQAEFCEAKADSLALTTKSQTFSDNDIDFRTDSESEEEHAYASSLEAKVADSLDESSQSELVSSSKDGGVNGLSIGTSDGHCISEEEQPDSSGGKTIPDCSVIRRERIVTSMIADNAVTSNDKDHVSSSNHIRKRPVYASDGSLPSSSSKRACRASPDGSSPLPNGVCDVLDDQ